MIQENLVIQYRQDFLMIQYLPALLGRLNFLFVQDLQWDQSVPVSLDYLLLRGYQHFQAFRWVLYLRAVPEYLLHLEDLHFR